MIASSVALKAKTRVQRWLGTICFGSIWVGLAASACSVPDFEFPADTMPVAGSSGSSNNGTSGSEPGTSGSGSVDHCTNGLLDEELGESDFDCGGGCNPCDVGQHCGDVADCLEGLCHEGTCIAAGCVNDIQDDTETDVDCGGGGCSQCITGQGCGQETDCESGVCVEAKCLAPACDDQVKNGKETALDCGGGCAPCAVDQPCVSPDDCISAECTESVCGPECPDGFANCDKKNENLCEINTRTDATNCGECGTVCDLPHANAECSAGTCQITTDGCDEGYADCNGLPEDGCEVNLEQDKLNCGVCNKVCPEINGAPFCAAGLCEITCTKGFDDCDDKRDNGCEKDVSKDVNNCGECAKKCTAQSGGTVYCKDDTCGETICPTGFGDCNGLPDDGCEVDLRVDANNCNTCGNLCLAANGTASCNNRVCQIAKCDTGYANCVGGYDDGCETNTGTDTAHCGGCNKPCSVSNGTAKCDAGACAINNCTGTFRDCDSSPTNGCEINIATSTQNCGGCGAAGQNCGTKYANATSTCSMSACTTPTCLTGYGDCTGGTGDGCETNTTSSPAHCGGCNMACSTNAGAHVSSNSCVSSQCDPKCSGTYATCDNNKFNGCEANKDDDENNCGGCGIVCNATSSAHVSSNECLGSNCDPVCSGTYGDCDSSRTNGCETNTSNSNSHCGACGNACSTAAAAHVSSNSCSGSNCNPVCSGLYRDCDASRENGCETSVGGDTNNCGGCDVVCGTQHASATGCSSGTCNPVCDSGWAKCSNPEQGCTTPLGTLTDCSKCGESCSGSTPFCNPTGCVAYRDIVVVNSGAANVGTNTIQHAIGGWNGSGGSPSELTVNHTLATAKSGGANNRMIIVGIAATDNFLDHGAPLHTDNIVVTYNGTTMSNVVEQTDSSRQSYAGIYYLLDANLPNNTGSTSYPVKVQFEPFNQWGHGGIDIVELKNTMQTAPLASGGSQAGNCSGSLSRSVSVTFSQTGSFAYGVLSARAGTSLTLTTPSITQTWNQKVTANPADFAAGAAYAWPVDSSRTFSWDVPTCYNSASAAVVIKRLSAN
jgi:hypothetical protein